MLKPEVLAMLRCPGDQSCLSIASGSLIAEVNQAIRQRQVRNRAGRILEQQLDGGLVTPAGNAMYPIIDEIPVLVRDEAIDLEPLEYDGNGVGADLPVA
jgi:uncharacterized protein YbaR (Trm112 family)